MPRKPRYEFENAVYHVTAQGDRKERIFLTEQNKTVFISKLNEVFARFQIVCYSYCLMNNHYHLFIRTALPNLSKAIHDLNCSYGNWYQSKYRICGHLFRNRYQSFVVDTEKYAILLSSYIHLNPVRARIVKHPEEYRFSSIREYLGQRQPLVHNLDTDFILSRFSDKSDKAQELYLDFIRQRYSMPDIRKEITSGTVLGDTEFLEHVKNQICPVKESDFSVEYSISSITANRIIDGICELYKTSLSSIISDPACRNLKKIALYLIRKKTSLTLKNAGQIFDMKESATSKMICRFSEELRNNPINREVLDTLEKDLNS